MMNLRLTLSVDQRLIFTGQKTTLLALYTASLEPVWGPPVKSQKIDRKIDFVLKP
jgi:hypothetical protein